MLRFCNTPGGVVCWAEDGAKPWDSQNAAHMCLVETLDYMHVWLMYQNKEHRS